MYTALRTRFDLLNTDSQLLKHVRTSVPDFGPVSGEEKDEFESAIVDVLKSNGVELDDKDDFEAKVFEMNGEIASDDPKNKKVKQDAFVESVSKIVTVGEFISSVDSLKEESLNIDESNTPAKGILCDDGLEELKETKLPQIVA
ncbi:hypothetical protein DdX_22447 [Ditylenchus destructor]|uniref:Uncharacterized protein n=1 Tax=Ditylenchus destructor TaxID=166010 RepID=A0AAD4ME33_9BILA|nr:hypothetical protein DdX_22447 [Ditylenchus destructor]